MATIDARRSHSLPKEEAAKKAEELARSFETKLGIRWRWEGDSVKFDAPAGAAKGVTGSVDVSPTEVRVQIDLPFLLRAIKGTIEAKVKERLDTLIGPA